MASKSGGVDKVKKKLFQYSPHKVGLALEAIRGGMKVSTASKHFNVPRTTLRHKISGDAPESSGRVGPQAVLGEEIEFALKEWIKESARQGFPINKEGLLDSVKKIVEEGNLKTPFINNRPSRTWFDAFMARHPDLSHKHAEYINKARALITEEKIRNWYEEVTNLLGPKNMEILKDPSRVWNCDETSFFLAPKGGLVLAEKGQHVYDTSKSSDKENITTLFTVNACGDYAPPLTVYKYKRMSSEVVHSAPKVWGVGKTDKGWMTGEAFYEYIGNIFLPYLKQKELLPVVLFLDGHKSHLTKHLSQLCRENGIIVVALVPNTTHMMQPLDVAVFFPLKQNWRKLVKRWRIENDGQEISKINLPSALHDLLVNNEDFANNVKAGFKTCGLYPFGPDFVNYKRIVKATSNPPTNSSNSTTKPITEKNYLEYLESKIEPHVLEEFRSTFQSGDDWKGNVEAIMLYDIWLSFKKDNSSMPLMLNKYPSKEQKQASPSVIDSVDNERNLNIIMATPNKNKSAEANYNHIDNELIFDNKENLTTAIVTPNECDSVTDIDLKSPDLSNLNPTSHKARLGHEDTVQDVLDKPLSVLANSSLHTASDLVRKCVLWPEKNISKNHKQAKYVPSVITSDKWVEIMEANDQSVKNKKSVKKVRPLQIPSKAKKRKTKVSTDTDTSVEKDDDIMLLDDQTDCEDWVSDTAPTFEEFEDIEPKIDDYVLVQFKKQKNVIYYVGQILSNKDDDENFEISYLRKRDRHNQFVSPLEPDLALVSLCDIKMIFPSPKLTGATKRQKSYISFDVNLSNFDVR